jgi:hypothetical protein
MKPKTDILIKYSELVGRYPLKKIFDYLNTLQKTGMTNMLGATPYLYGGREWIQKQIDYFDIEEDENIEKLLDTADNIKDVIIAGALKKSEKEKSNDLIRSVERRIKIEASDILKIWMDFKGKVLKESVIIETKYDKKAVVKFLFRRVTKDELDTEFLETRDWYLERSSRQISYEKFLNMFITMMIDGIHWKLIDAFIDENIGGEYYDSIMEIIKNIYESKIKDLWFKLTEENY